MRVIILHVVVMRLVENAVRIVVAIRVFISYSSCLTYWVGIYSANDVVWARSIDRVLSILTIRSLTCYQQNSFMKTTYNWYFWWLLRRLGRLLLVQGHLLVLTLRLTLWLTCCLLGRSLWLLTRCVLRILRRTDILLHLIYLLRRFMLWGLFLFTVLCWAA